MELFGNKVRLRPVDDSDIDDLYHWWNDPEFSGEYAGFEPKNRAEFQGLVKKEGWFIISSRSEDRKIGFIAYYRVRSDYLNLFEIGYRIMPNERSEEGHRKDRVSD